MNLEWILWGEIKNSDPNNVSAVEAEGTQDGGDHRVDNDGGDDDVDERGGNDEDDNDPEYNWTGTEVMTLTTIENQECGAAKMEEEERINGETTEMVVDNEEIVEDNKELEEDNKELEEDNNLVWRDCGWGQGAGDKLHDLMGGGGGGIYWGGWRWRCLDSGVWRKSAVGWCGSRVWEPGLGAEGGAVWL